MSKHINHYNQFIKLDIILEDLIEYPLIWNVYKISILYISSTICQIININSEKSWNHFS